MLSGHVFFVCVFVSLLTLEYIASLGFNCILILRTTQGLCGLKKNVSKTSTGASTHTCDLEGGEILNCYDNTWPYYLLFFVN